MFASPQDMVKLHHGMWTQWQPTKCENIFTNYTSNTVLISKIYNKFTQENRYQENNQNEKKIVTDLNREFSIKETQIAEKNLSKCSPYLAFWEKQTKSNLRFHLLYIRMTVLSKASDNHAGKDGKDVGNTLPLLLEVQTHTTKIEISVGAPQKYENQSSSWTVGSTLWHILKKCFIQAQGLLLNQVHCCSAHNSQKMEIT